MTKWDYFFLGFGAGCIWVLLLSLLLVTPANAGTVVELKGSKVTGSGTFVTGKSGRNLILTNWHVCRGNGVMIVRELGKQDTSAQMLHSDQAQDMCVLEPRVKRDAFEFGLPPVYTEKLINIKRNQETRAGRILETVISDILGYPMLIQDTDIEAHYGDSGSPVIDSTGKLVGLMECTIWNRWGCMIPVISIRAYLERF